MTRIAPLLLLPLTACLGGPDGIYLVQVAYSDAATCGETVTHNFKDSYTEEDAASDWTETESEAHSDALYFAQVSGLTRGEATMVIGTQVWKGLKGDGDAWSFAWDATDEISDALQYKSDYKYTELVSRSENDTIDLVFDGNTAAGDWTVVSSESIAWTESDQWDAEAGLTSGAIPSTEYLSYDDGPDEGLPRTNSRAGSECSASDCRLATETTCDTSGAITMTQSDYRDDGAYDQLEGVSHPFGTGIR